jgi:hypothetical protein
MASIDVGVLRYIRVLAEEGKTRANGDAKKTQNLPGRWIALSFIQQDKARLSPVQTGCDIVDGLDPSRKRSSVARP